MKMRRLSRLLGWLTLSVSLAAAQERPQMGLPPYGAWAHTGSLFILTTPEGGDVPAGVRLEGFPLLVRLYKDSFPFNQARPQGEDVRFSSRGDQPLPYQIEEWNIAAGEASIWVRIPLIQGNEQQELRLHWGNPTVDTASDGKAVFNESNGYLSVWHMGEEARDEVGTLVSKDVGTTACAGLIGQARHLAGGQGLFGGEKISRYPTGSSPHSSEVWMRAEKSNGRPLAWGNEQGQGKVVMLFQSPPHIRMDCYFSGADVVSEGRIPISEWSHIVHTYQQGDSRVYVNGVLSGVSTRPNSPLAIKSPARLWIGGWYHHYDFVGDIDEVRISKTARSADWVRLQHENQKAQQTVVGPVVQPGSTLSVSPSQATVLEGQGAPFKAQAGGARKVFWSLVQDGKERVVAVDQFSYRFDAGRVSSDTSATLRFTAVFAKEVKTVDVPLSIREDIAEPIFTLTAPRTWDGRRTVEIVPQISNLKAMRARSAGELKMEWHAGPLAVIKEIAPGKLVLTRAQNSGTLTVTATISNGGKPVTQSATIEVREPKRDPWALRKPAKDEVPEDGQFYARDDRNEGTLHCNGILSHKADSVFLKLYADDALIRTETAKPGTDKSYALTMKLKPGLVKYKVEFGVTTNGQEALLRTATNLVCGDAYLIDGQSNALATDTGEKSPAETHDWIRSYGRPPERRNASVSNLWCLPVWKAEAGEKAELGWWGMELAKRLVDSQKVPIFMLNAAAGGTRIDQHQRNASEPTDLSTIYGRMLWRVQQAKLTHGIRGILWHQGENDQGADGPTGGFGWETYQSMFVEMSAGWKRDFPNVQHYYVYQIWPDSCSMGGRKGSGDMLRERQRTLPQLYSKLSVLSTLGIRPPGGCHFPLEGWAQLAHLVQPLIERDHYGKRPTESITPPNLVGAFHVNGTKYSILLEFDQPVIWADVLAEQFYLDGVRGKVVSGSASGNGLTLLLQERSTAKTITYLKEVQWSQDRLLQGVNGLAALTFCEVPLQTP